jgi:Zn-dependent oligopeptidase
MQLIVSRLFGCELIEVKMASNESWCNDSSVRKFELIDSSSKQLIGRMYFDPWSRQGKLTGPACFTVRCGRRLMSDEIGEVNGVINERLMNDDGTLGDTCRYQLPVLALVANFEGPSHGNHCSSLSSQRIYVICFLLFW